MIQLTKVLPINLVLNEAGKKVPVGGMHPSQRIDYEPGMKNFAIYMADYPDIIVLDLDTKDHPLIKYIDQTYTHETRKGWHCFFQNSFNLTTKRQKQKEKFDLLAGKNWCYYDYNDPDVAVYKEYNPGTPIAPMPTELYDLVKVKASDIGEDSLQRFTPEPLLDMLREKKQGIWKEGRWSVENSSDLAWAVTVRLIPYTDDPLHIKKIFDEIGPPRVEAGLTIFGIEPKHALPDYLSRIIVKAKEAITRTKLCWRPRSDYRAVDWAGRIVYADIDKSILVEKTSYDFTAAPFIDNKLLDRFVETYQEVVFDPRISDKFSEGKYNLYNGFIEPEPGDGHIMFLEYVKDVLCSSNDDQYAYLVKYMAHLAQFPWDKPDVAIVLFGREKGTGKDTFHELLGQILNPGGYLPLTEEAFMGRFNGQLANIMLTVAEELVFGGSHKEDSKLKSMITSQTRVIEKKGKEPITVANYLRLVVTSNSSRPVKATKGERRFFAIKPSDIKKGNFDYWLKLRQDFNPHHLLHFLLNVDLTGYSTREIPTRSSIDEIIDMNKDQATEAIELWWETVYDGYIVDTTEIFNNIIGDRDKYMTKRKLTQLIFDTCGKEYFRKTQRKGNNVYIVEGYREKPKTDEDGLDGIQYQPDI